MSKRGQVTVFLVIGIVVLFLAALFFYIFGQLKEAPLEVEAEESVKSLGVSGAVQAFVEKCIKDTVDPAIFLLAAQGGMIYPKESDPVLLTDHGLVNYAWLNGINGLSRGKMEEDLATYLEENIDFCLGGFETFKKQNITVLSDYEKIKAEVSIQKSAIRITLNFPLQVILSNGDERDLDAFSAQQPSSLGAMLETIEALRFPNIGPQDFLNIPYQPAVFPFDESVVIYSLSRNEPDEPLSFIFAVRDDFPENKPPVLDFIPDRTFTVGDRWTEEITAEDPNDDILTFSSSSELFPINEDGSIDINLTGPGIFDVNFKVEDGRGGADQQEVSVLVLEK